MGTGCTSACGGVAFSACIDRFLRRRRQIARQLRRPMSRRAPIAAPTPMPALAPVLRLEVGVVVDCMAPTVDMPELEACEDLDATRLVGPEVVMLELEELELEGLELEVLELGVLELGVLGLGVLGLGVLDVDGLAINVLEGGGLGELLVVGAAVDGGVVSSVGGVYPSNRLMAPPSEAGRLTWFARRLGAEKAISREPASSGQ